MKHPTRLTAAIISLLPTLTWGQSIPLSNTWIKYDPTNLMTLSAQSDTGFTASIATNNTGQGTTILPRVYQTFPSQPFTNNGARVTVTFDLVVNTPMVVGDTQYRFGLANTSKNELIWVGYDMGAPNGTCVRMRMDVSGTGITIPGGESAYLDGNWNDAFISSPNLTGFLNLASGNMFPNAVGIGIAATITTKHHFRYAVERTPGQLLQETVWSNSAGTAIVGNTGYYDELSNSTNTPPTWQQIDAFGFGCNNNGMFGAAGGSYTISNLKIYPGFAITNMRRDENTGDVELTWESNPYDGFMSANYVVQCATNLNPPIVWNSIATVTSVPTSPEGFWTSYTNAATTDSQQYYRIQKVYP